MTEESTDIEAGAGSESSDLSQLLDNLQLMVITYMGAASSKARKAWMVMFGIEVSFITLKLRAMRKRWQVYLPFHEVIDVNFEKRLDEVETWLNLFGEGQDEEMSEYVESVLDTGYLLDLMGFDVEPIKPGLSSDELKAAVQTYCKKVDKLLKRQSVANWEELAMNRVELNVHELIDRLDAFENVCAVCRGCVRALADELRALEDFFSSELKEEQFMVLANRLMHRDCQHAIKQAHDQVRKAHNAWPQKYVKDQAVALKEHVKMRLITEAHGEDLKEYIDLDYPDLLGDACFGQYLFRDRHKLTTEDVQKMVMLCTMIVDLNEYIDPNLTIKKRKEAALGRELDAEEKAIVKSLLAFADKAEWRAGATADSIKLGINRMLGVGFHLDPEMQQHSDALWKMFKTRRNCDADKSLMVTWLNIVGYCVAQRYLSGGSPALCKLFFPKCGFDDYKAIDKGRVGEPASFKKVFPLLDRFLK